MGTLSSKELNRYSRHLSLKGFNTLVQEKLKRSSTLVVGAGGLGCPVLQYLVAAGIGKIGIVDHDHVHESNLQRQVLYAIQDIGTNKAEAAKERLSQLNPFVELLAYPIQLTSQNAFTVLKEFDVIVDGSDNFQTRYLLNDACILLNKPLVFGSALEYEGQVAVFNVNQGDQYSSNYRDLFPVPPASQTVRNCEQAGVLGSLTGIIGSIQSSEVIKLLTGVGEPLINKLLLVDSFSSECSIIKIKNNGTRNTVKELIDYEHFCGSRPRMESGSKKEITVHQLMQLRISSEDFQLIDVRESYEYDEGNLNAESIPLSTIQESVNKINKEKKVILYCKSGDRSNQALAWLEKNHHFKNLYTLKGGISAWVNEIDPTIPIA